MSIWKYFAFLHSWYCVDIFFFFLHYHLKILKSMNMKRFNNFDKIKMINIGAIDGPIPS